MLLNGAFFLFENNFKEISKKFKNFKIFFIFWGAKTRFLRNIYEKVFIFKKLLKFFDF